MRYRRRFSHFCSAFGKLNILVNNAGYTWDGMLHKMTDKQWDAMLSVHNTAPFRIIRAASPFMRDAAKEEQEKNGKPEPRCIINVHYSLFTLLIVKGELHLWTAWKYWSGKLLYWYTYTESMVTTL